MDGRPRHGREEHLKQLCRRVLLLIRSIFTRVQKTVLWILQV